MKKYQLFSEYSDNEIYGDTLIDALLHAGLIPRPSTFKDGRPLPTPPLEITKIIGVEDVSDSTRGNIKFHRVLIEDSKGIRKSIDAKELTTTIEKVD